MTAPGVRLGLVSYLNAKPIGYGLVSGRQRGRFTLVHDVPSALADELAAGRLDLALLPSVEYARAHAAGRAAAIVPGIAIASLGAAQSVLLFSRVPSERIRTVALDLSSRTSAALLRLLLRRKLRPNLPAPEFVPAAPDLPAMLRHCDAALLIGDPALLAFRDHAALVSGLSVVDLGAEWTAATGRPFVFAFWAGPSREDSPEIVASLQDSLREGLGQVPAIARQAASGDAVAEALFERYLTSSIRYTLGREEIRGLELFYRMLSEDGLVAGPPPKLVFHRSPACTREP